MEIPAPDVVFGAENLLYESHFAGFFHKKREKKY